MVSLSDIQNIFSGTIKLGEPLAKYTSLGVGGAADYLLEPASNDEMKKLVEYFRKSEFPFVVLQPNLLVSEKGFRGAVIVMNDRLAHPILKNGATMFKPLNGTSPTEFIQRADVNGLLWGGAEVVGNCVVNAHRATAHELYSLVHHVRQIIANRCGVDLELDLQFIGFEQPPLAKVA